MASFAIGRTVLHEFKAVRGNAKTLPVGTYVPVASIILPGSGWEYLCTMQVRLPAGCWAKMRLVRSGTWPGHTRNDQTGHHPFRPVPGDGAFSDGHSHPVSGGGTLSYQLKVYAPPGAATCIVPTIVVKAKRII